MDSGPLYASIDADDAYHSACLELLTRHPGPLIVPQLVIAEVAYFIEKWLGADREVRLVADLSRGVFQTEPVQSADWVRVGQLLWRYRTLRLGIVDASVIAAAERLQITTVATLDRRHFAVVRPHHVEVLTLLP